MRYTCDDFKEIKCENGNQCIVGVFGADIYAVSILVEEGHHHYHNIYCRITEEEFNSYPANTEVLLDKYLRGNEAFLCSDYIGKGHRTYGFEL